MPDLSISALAHASGFSSSALRYYERVGLLAPTARSAGGYRQYDDRALERLQFIARAKRLGLHLDEIGDLVALWEHGPCAPVQARLRELVDEKVALLEAQAEAHARFHAQLVHVQRSLAATDPAERCGPGCGCDTEWSDPPAIACSLDRAAVPGRWQAWQAVLDRVEARRASPHGIRLRFAPDPELLGTLASLAAREVDCCSFFTFAISIDTSAAWLSVTAPDDAAPLVRELFGPVDQATD